MWLSSLRVLLVIATVTARPTLTAKKGPITININVFLDHDGMPVQLMHGDGSMTDSERDIADATDIDAEPPVAAKAKMIETEVTTAKSPVTTKPKDDATTAAPVAATTTAVIADTKTAVPVTAAPVVVMTSAPAVTTAVVTPVAAPATTEAPPKKKTKKKKSRKSKKSKKD